MRVWLLSPRFGSILTLDIPRVVFRWKGVPGASGYELAFATNLRALGLDSQGNALPPSEGQRPWRNRDLVLHVNLSAEQMQFIPSTSCLLTMAAG